MTVSNNFRPHETVRSNAARMTPGYVSPFSHLRRTGGRASHQRGRGGVRFSRVKSHRIRAGGASGRCDGDGNRDGRDDTRGIYFRNVGISGEKAGIPPRAPGACGDMMITGGTHRTGGAVISPLCLFFPPDFFLCPAALFHILQVLRAITHALLAQIRIFSV